MTRKRFKPEDIVNKLREADALLSKGQTVAQACKQIGVTGFTYYRWPRPSPCARPSTLIAGQPGDRFTLDVDFQDGRQHLPIISLKRAA